MQPIRLTKLPDSVDFFYEIKYDGFRAILYINQSNVQLISRNAIDLSKQFPEIITAGETLRKEIRSICPVQLDGEIVILNSSYQSNFSLLQKRGRSKNNTTILNAAKKRPASFMAFDLLLYNGESIRNQPYIDRKQKLASLLMPTELHNNPIKYVKPYKDLAPVWRVISDEKGEGIVAKRTDSTYTPGKSHNAWFKQKNWRTVYCFLVAYDTYSNYFTVAIYNEGKVSRIGKCKHGLDNENAHILKQLFKTEGTKSGNIYTLPPAICAELHTLGLYSGELREPEFSQLLPNENPENCTLKRLLWNVAMLPKSVTISNKEKVFWPKTGTTKGELLVYMRNIACYMLPFLKNRVLTVIRAPDGITGPSFYQKSLPSYAPNYIHSISENKKRLIVCDSLEALIWLANHGAIEYHVPFQSAHLVHPNEIVFDLDPPDRDHFQLAVEAGLLIKRLLDDLALVSFVKTSGNKGLQIHIPIRNGSMTYNETALLTEAIAKTIEAENPLHFTTERLKKNRGGRLYIDYVQHGKDKTIIAPYSPRLTESATIATPLFWDELNSDLSPTMFSVNNITHRIQTVGCPFANYFASGEKQQMENILRLV
ncbi:DNA ligase D [Virgibacillus sp. W0430]|uniref:DNA ligase D n=1 Tax=Virgibacillus sp. W0430 TaxID=3391580 RepID=UPI003F448CD3